MILYSPFATAHIANEEDYLQAHFWQPEDAAHVCKGTISAFCTGSPGEYTVRLFMNVDETEFAHDFAIALCLQIKDKALCIRDLYDLMEWDPSCPPEQQIEIDDGFYHVVVGTNRPPSGIFGRDQTIDIFLEPRTSLPKIVWPGVPQFSY